LTVTPNETHRYVLAGEGTPSATPGWIEEVDAP
jgi:hypothetical protein